MRDQGTEPDARERLAPCAGLPPGCCKVRISRTWPADRGAWTVHHPNLESIAKTGDPRSAVQLTSAVREAVEAVDREVARLAGHTSVEDAPALDRLRASWGRLVDLLALGPAPERRACPHCGGVGMLDATLCGRCWTELAPLQGSHT